MDSKSPPILFWWELHCKNRKITEFVRVLLEDPAKGPSKRFFPLSHHLVFTSLCLTPHSQVLYFTFSSYSIWRNTQNKIYCDDKTSPPQKKKILRPDGKRVKQVITRHLIAMTNFWSTVHVMSSIALWCSLSEQKHICLRGSLGCYVLSEEWKWSTFIFVRVWGFFLCFSVKHRSCSGFSLILLHSPAALCFAEHLRPTEEKISSRATNTPWIEEQLLTSTLH